MVGTESKIAGKVAEVGERVVGEPLPVQRLRLAKESTKQARALAESEAWRTVGVIGKPVAYTAAAGTTVYGVKTLADQLERWAGETASVVGKGADELEDMVAGALHGAEGALSSLSGALPKTGTVLWLGTLGVAAFVTYEASRYFLRQ